MFTWFKKKSFLGIDISDYSIEIFQIGRDRRVLFGSRVLLDAKVVADGRILSREILAERLKIMLGNAPAPFPPAVLGMPEARVFVHFFTIAEGIEGPDLDKEILANAFQVIPVDPKTLYWDYLVTKFKGEQEVFFAAVDKEVLNEYLNVMRLVGINLTAVEVGSSALARALLRYPRAGSVAMIIDVGARATNISIFEDKNIPVLSVAVPIGGDHFTETIAAELKVSKLKTDRLKKALGFGWVRDNNSVFAVLEVGFESIVKEIQSSISYYEKKRNKEIGEIILAGGSSLLPKLDEYLAFKIKRPVKVGNPLTKIKQCLQLEKPGRAILSAGAIGLALGGLDDRADGINLLKRADSLKSSVSTTLPSGKLNNLWADLRKRMKFR